MADRNDFMNELHELIVRGDAGNPLLVLADMEALNQRASVELSAKDYASFADALIAFKKRLEARSEPHDEMVIQMRPSGDHDPEPSELKELVLKLGDILSNIELNHLGQTEAIKLARSKLDEIANDLGVMPS
jgi:hypothetical protein